MAGPFGKQTAPSNRPKRNTFDLSHQNNLTMEFGKLYPFLCEPVIPGDSVRLDTAFGIRAMPTAFPLQTKIRADVHYFYVRNRNLWKDWPDFIGQTRDDLVMPYVTNKTMPLSNGSLSDYLNIPTSVSSTGSPYPSYFEGDSSVVFTTAFYKTTSSPYSFRPNSYFLSTLLGTSYTDDYTPPFGYQSVGCSCSAELSGLDAAFFSTSRYIDIVVSSPDINSELDARSVVFFPCWVNNDSFAINHPSPYSGSYTPTLIFTYSHKSHLGYTYRLSIIDPTIGLINDYEGVTAAAYFFQYVSEDPDLFLAGFVSHSDFADSLVGPFQATDFSNDGFQSFTFRFYSVSSDIIEAGYAPVFESLKLNALPFRAYESIYNAFYRDDRNNPYILNGEKVYNKYLPTQDGGLDENVYSLRSRNWEQDFLTTAVLSPQQGIAPLVGISSTGVASFALDDGSVEKVQLKVGEDGDTIVGAEYSNNLSPSVARQLVNVATSGISINDFRGVNALQRWLEINIRRGLKYKDQIESHFGVTPSYAELDMPEFLGGATQWFDSSQVNQTSEASSGSPLGSYAGQLSLVGGSNHPVTRFFDEHGYIIGIISISPVPVYISTLHADFLKFSPLDYFFPEFAHLGYQPIPYAQVSPLEYLREGEPLSETFGYQRAWYEYMSRTDEAHGDFRGDLRDFLLMRRFAVSPSLSEDFLTIDQRQLNQVFTVNEINGKPVMPFLGQIHIKEIFKRPIPRYQISTLE